MSDSEHSTVTYTSVPSSVEDYSDIGSPEVDGPLSPDYVSGLEEPEQAPLSPDYMPSPEELEQAPLSPDYVSGLEEPEQASLLPDYVPGLEEPKQAPPSLVYLPYEVTEPLPQIPSPPLPIPSPPPDSPTHIEILESCLPLRKRLRFASPTPSQEIRESSAASAARQNEPAIARDDPYSLVREELYGFVDRVDVTPERLISKELGVNQRVTDLSTIVEHETTIMYSMMEEAQDDQSQLGGRVNLLYRDWSVHRHLEVMVEREARMAREA
nr:hypothetical protein [Tanacetum cinerariifolium]